MVRYLIAVLMLLLSISYAQTCAAELQGDYTAEALLEPATGLDAALIMERAVELLEPMLPPLKMLPEPFRLEPTDAGFETAAYLSERGLLPDNWQPDALEEGVWQTMMARLAAWYDLGGPVPPAALTRQGLIEALGTLIAQVKPRLQPVVVIASDAQNPDAVAFWSVVRNDTVYPRMMIFRPPEEAVGLSRGAENVLPLLETCALELDNFVSAPLETAQRLFLTNNRSRMIIAATSPASPDELSYVPQGEEPAYFAFQAPELEGLNAYAAIFDGPSLGPAAILRIIPQLRTNMNPRDILAFVQP